MRRIVYTPEADAQLVQLYHYIAREASPAIAAGFTDAIVDQCESLHHFPNRGTPRDDIRPGLRTITFRRRVVIAYAVSADAVTIVGIFYGGQDYEAILEGE
ncbi:MAG: type II toxin-antitoxin system RelE/ParE family toxin [Sphingomonas sp.]